MIPFILLILMAGLSAFSVSVPACLNTYSAVGVNFTTQAIGSPESCTITNPAVFNPNTKPFTSACPDCAFGGTWYGNKVNIVGSSFNTTMYADTLAEGEDVIYTRSTGSAGRIYCTNDTLTTTASTIYTCNVTSYNTTFYQINCTGAGKTCLQNKTGQFAIYTESSGTGARLNISFKSYSSTFNFSTPASQVGYFSNYSGYYLWADTPGKTSIQELAPTTANTFPAALYYQTYQINPHITYFPGNSSYPNYYNATNGLAYLKNNTPTYVFDLATNLWYFVPAVTVATFTDNLTISVYLYPSGTTTGGVNTSSPVLPAFQSCAQVGDQYIINSSYSIPVTFLVQYSNSTYYSYYTTDATSIYYAVNTTQFPNINYSAAGYTQCIRNVNASILPLPIIGSSGQTGMVEQIILISMVGVGVFQPFALIFAVGYNQVFEIISVDYMALLAVIGFVISTIVGGLEKFSLKGLILFTALIMSIAIIYYAKAGYDSAPLTGFMNSMDSITKSQNIEQFIVANVAFIINFLYMVLQLPVLVLTSILLPIRDVAPQFYSYAAAISNGLILAFYAFLLVKAYEVLSNKFRDV